MVTSSLLTHCGARVVTRDELNAIEAPAPTATWFPVKHGTVIDTVTRLLGDAGFQINGVKYAVTRNDARMFAVMDLVAAVEHHQPRRVVLDFQNVRALGSLAFRPVISLHRRVQELNGRLLLCGLTSAVAQIFHLTGLVNPAAAGLAPFSAEANLESAVARLSRPDGNP